MLLTILLQSYCFAVESSSCVKWGNSFDVPLEATTVNFSCIHPTTHNRVCCEALEGYSVNSKPSHGVGNAHAYNSRQLVEKTSCRIQKDYHSSPQELRDLEVAIKISSMDPGKSIRQEALLDYITSQEITVNSTRWLSRISWHMNNIYSSSTPHPDDLEFLSYFKVSKICDDVVIKTWIEWIEPVTITARHPFGFGRCRPMAKYYQDKSDKRKRPKVNRANVDYVLLQSGKQFHDQSHFDDGRRHQLSSSPSSSAAEAESGPKFYLLDSGTSTFDSSLFWFTCAYSQVTPPYLTIRN